MRPVVVSLRLIRFMRCILSSIVLPVMIVRDAPILPACGLPLTRHVRQTP